MHLIYPADLRPGYVFRLYSGEWLNLSPVPTCGYRVVSISPTGPEWTPPRLNRRWHIAADLISHPGESHRAYFTIHQDAFGRWVNYSNVLVFDRPTGQLTLF